MMSSFLALSTWNVRAAPLRSTSDRTAFFRGAALLESRRLLAADVGFVDFDNRAFPAHRRKPTRRIASRRRCIMNHVDL